MKRQWSADVTITTRLVIHLLEEQFPMLAPVAVEPFGEGWDNALYLVNHSYVFRFPRRGVAAPLQQMENELLPRLAPVLPIPIPNPRWMGQATVRYPFTFSGYKKLHGTEVYFFRPGDETRAKSAALWGGFLRTLHAIGKEQALRWKVASSDTIGRMDVDKRTPMFIEKVSEAQQKGLLTHPEALLGILPGLPSTGQLARLVNLTLVHGDLNFRNFLLDDDGKLCGVLDWGDAHIGHPAVDLSVAYSFLPPAARAEFFRVYGTVDALTLQLAKFRALYTNLVILLYADDIGDADQVAEAQRAINLTLLGD